MALYGILLGRDRWGLVGWSIGLFAYFLVIGASYATVKDHPGLDQVWEELPQSLRDAFGGAPSITTPGGYLESQGTSLLPLVLGGALLAHATRRLSGAEQAGELDLVLSLPVRRGSYFWAHWAVGLTHGAAWTGAAALGTVVGMATTGASGDTLLRLAYMVVEVLPFGVALHAGGFLLGAALHRRPPGLATGVSVLAVMFLLHVVGSLDDSVDWLRLLSPYALWVQGEPFEYRTEPWYLAMTAALSLTCLAFAHRAWRLKDFKG